MPVTVRFVESPGWVQLLLSEPVAAALTQVQAEALLEGIERNNPSRRGAYAASFADKSGTEPGNEENGMAMTKVVLGEPRWHLIEFGNAKYAGAPNPPYAPIRRAADSLGFRWQQS